MNTAFLNVVNDRKLSLDLRQIADDFEILDFFHQYGSCCFTISSLLTKVLTEKGYSARVQGCYAEIKQSNSVFYIGYKAYTHDKQREAHVVCIVEERYLLDFGLGSLKKYYDEGFSHALACEIQDDVRAFGRLDLVCGKSITWCKDWISPVVEKELLAQESGVNILLQRYNDFQKNRMSHLMKKLFVSNHKLQAENSPLAVLQCQSAPASACD